MPFPSSEELSTSIRLLTREDVSIFIPLRLRSLKEDANVFLSTYESEAQLQEEAFANHLAFLLRPPSFGYFGIFQTKKLIGYIQVAPMFVDKQKHIAMINNVYILPEYRGQGVASKLFQYIFEVLGLEKKIERLYLTCAATNQPALQLYKNLGFQQYAVKAQSIKWKEHYDDEIELVKVL